MYVHECICWTPQGRGIKAKKRDLTLPWRNNPTPFTLTALVKSNTSLTHTFKSCVGILPCERKLNKETAGLIWDENIIQRYRRFKRCTQLVNNSGGFSRRPCSVPLGSKYENQWQWNGPKRCLLSRAVSMQLYRTISLCLYTLKSASECLCIGRQTCCASQMAVALLSVVTGAVPNWGTESS